MPTREVSATEVGQFYLELHQRLHRTLDAAMTSAGLSMSRAKVLMQLSEHGPMNQAAIAARLGFAARSVTDTVDGLERDGLAVRVDDPGDRRARIVEITTTGCVALERAVKAKKKTMNQIFGSLDASERAEFVALLTSIKANLGSGESFVE